MRGTIEKRAVLHTKIGERCGVQFLHEWLRFYKKVNVTNLLTPAKSPGITLLEFHLRIGREVYEEDMDKCFATKAKIAQELKKLKEVRILHEESKKLRQELKKLKEVRILHEESPIFSFVPRITRYNFCALWLHA